MSSYNRGQLLDRSLDAYSRQTFNGFELIIIDDGLTDNTKEICDKWSSKLNIRYFKVRKPKGLIRDGAVNINFGIEQAQTDFIIQTHPEYMPAHRTVEWFYNNRQELVYMTAKEYCLTEEQQNVIDSVNWREDFSEIKNLPNFYSTFDREGYDPRRIEQMGPFETTQFCGMHRNTWEVVGGFPPLAKMHECDGEFFRIRQKCNIPTQTFQTEIGVHQWHAPYLQPNAGKKTT
jgi:glycosyltransferase involved in cell wall biosynthesis